LGRSSYRREVKNDLMRLGKKSLQCRSAPIIGRRDSERQSNHLLIRVKKEMNLMELRNAPTG